MFKWYISVVNPFYKTETCHSFLPTISSVVSHFPPNFASIFKWHMQERTASNRTSQFHSHFLTQTSTHTQTHLSGKLSIFHIQHFSSAAKLLAAAAAGKAAKYTQFLLHVAYVCVRADVSVRGAHTHTHTHRPFAAWAKLVNVFPSTSSSSFSPFSYQFSTSSFSLLLRALIHPGAVLLIFANWLHWLYTFQHGEGARGGQSQQLVALPWALGGRNQCNFPSISLVHIP